VQEHLEETEIKKKLASLFLLSMSALHRSDRLIRSAAPGSIPVPHGSGMTYTGLFGAE